MKTTTTADAPGFAKALEGYIDLAQSFVSDDEGPSYPENCRTLLVAERGRRYVKLVATGVGDSTRRSAHCFIDPRTGDILKTSSWTRAAKGVRGNVFTATHGRRP